MRSLFFVRTREEIWTVGSSKSDFGRNGIFVNIGRNFEGSKCIILICFHTSKVYPLFFSLLLSHIVIISKHKSRSVTSVSSVTSVFSVTSIVTASPSSSSPSYQTRSVISIIPNQIRHLRPPDPSSPSTRSVISVHQIRHLRHCSDLFSNILR